MTEVRRLSGADGRGQMTTGLLLVFIAVLLIGTITAGVFFDVAGVLEGQAEDTSDDTTAQLSDQIEVVAITGTAIDRNPDPPEITEIDIVVTTTRGAESIDLQEVTILWVGEGGHQLVEATTADPGEPTFDLVSFADPGGTFPVLTETDDRYAIRLRPGGDFGDSGLAEGERAEVTITTSDGASRTLTIAAPQSLAGKDSVEL